MTIGFGIRGILAENVESGQFAALHGLEHRAQMPAFLRRDVAAPGSIELGAQFVVFDMLEAGRDDRG